MAKCPSIDEKTDSKGAIKSMRETRFWWTSVALLCASSNSATVSFSSYEMSSSFLYKNVFGLLLKPFYKDGLLPLDRLAERLSHPPLAETFFLNMELSPSHTFWRIRQSVYLRHQGVVTGHLWTSSGQFLDILSLASKDIFWASKDILPWGETLARTNVCYTLLS